jgi:hypothetical protein
MMIERFGQSGADVVEPAIAAEWRQWAYTEALKKKQIAGPKAVVITPLIERPRHGRDTTAYLGVALAALDGLASARAIPEDRRVAVFAIRQPVVYGQKGIRIEVLPARRCGLLAP